MLFKFLFASAVSQSFGMRPEGGNSRSTTLARLGEVVASAAHAVAAESMHSLQEASGIVNSILLQSGNATDHMTDDDVALLNSVIDMIDNAIYGSMDSSHQADVAAIQAAIDAASLCNSNIAARLGEDGDLNKLYLGTAGYQSTLNDLQGDVNDKTAANNSKFDELDRHINNIGSSPDCVDFPNGPTKLKADNFFAGSDFVNWYTARQDAYAPIADAFETADQNLKDAITAYKVGLAERDVAYCDWKVELEGGCATFDQCYQDKVDHYNNELKPALQKDMQVRIDAYKAGSTIIAQIRFLLGESTESAPPTDVDTSRFQLTFQHVPPQGECDLSPLHSADWAPEPECSDEVDQSMGLSQARCGDPESLLAGGSGHVEQLALGIKVWADRNYTVSSFPAEMAGAHLYRLANVKLGFPSNLQFAGMVVGSTLFVCSEHGERGCGYSTSLPADGFTNLSGALVWSGRPLECYERVVNVANFALPTVTTSQCVQSVALKCEAR